MKTLFSKDGWEDFLFWFDNDRKIFKKIVTLIKESKRTPFDGTGKPEPLKHELAKRWSRRIDKKHRFTYSVENDVLSIHSCRHHYYPPNKTNYIVTSNINNIVLTFFVFVKKRQKTG